MLRNMAQRRRTYGTGSVSRKKGTDAWLVRIELGDDPLTGERRRISRTVHGNKTAAQTVLDELRAEHMVSGSRRQAESALTLRELVGRWRASCNHATGTAANYDRAFDLVPNHMMLSPAARVTTETLDQLYAALLREGAALDRVLYLHAGIGAAFTAGVRWRLVRQNPARTTRPLPRPVRKRQQKFDSSTPGRLLAGCRTDQERAWIALHVVTGARKSEILALRWSDVDLEASTVTIFEALDPVAAGAPRKETKGRDRRVLPVEPAAMDRVRAWRAAAVERASAAGAVIPTGGYLFSDDVDAESPWLPSSTSNAFGRLRARASVSGVSLHGLRHLVATLAQDAGIAPAKVQDFLGHADIQSTMGYTGAMPTGAGEVAAFLGGLLERPNLR